MFSTQKTSGHQVKRRQFIQVRALCPAPATTAAVSEVAIGVSTLSRMKPAFGRGARSNLEGSVAMQSINARCDQRLNLCSPCTMISKTMLDNQWAPKAGFACGDPPQHHNALCDSMTQPFLSKIIHCSPYTAMHETSYTIKPKQGAPGDRLIVARNSPRSMKYGEIFSATSRSMNSDEFLARISQSPSPRGGGREVR